MTPTERHTEPESPPFRDSDAIQIVIKRLDLVADMMRRHDYGSEFTRQMQEVADWLEWLSVSIAARNDDDLDAITEAGS